ncbi:PH domain-containing protein [Mammaliicoccus sp. Dog046]|uniref:PH domain-containing protein n=1 Tax=Mammaliicoccus sp. Dog046 TaxID=3034233 RepID=UPI002B261C93|nr:PH domain-containing protein [Mammaliicoccus sp. Dog046]WQK86132.1 PH domain-containing protein [Mammaliicoccus sp. Dog046]
MLPRYRMNKQGMNVERIVTFIPVIILLFIAISMFILSTYWWQWLSHWYSIIPLGLAVVLAIYGMVIKPYYMYQNFRYEVQEDEINVKSGIFMIEETMIPIGRIQNVDLYEGFIMRKFKLANITLSTAGGRVEIKYLHRDKANQIKLSIQNRIKVE